MVIAQSGLNVSTTYTVNTTTALVDPGAGTNTTTMAITGLGKPIVPDVPVDGIIVGTNAIAGGMVNAVSMVRARSVCLPAIPSVCDSLLHTTLPVGALVSPPTFASIHHPSHSRQ
jgi:hypothetical protein